MFCVELKPSLLSPTTSTTSTSQVSLWNLVGILLYPGGLMSSGIEIFSLYIKYFPRQLQFIQCFIFLSSRTMVTEVYALGTPQLFRQTGCTLTRAKCILWHHLPKASSYQSQNRQPFILSEYLSYEILNIYVIRSMYYTRVCTTILRWMSLYIIIIQFRQEDMINMPVRYLSHEMYWTS